MLSIHRREVLSGPVRSVRIDSFECSPHACDGRTHVSSTSEEYDEHGRLLLQYHEEFQPFPGVPTRTVSRYEAGRITDWEEYGQDGSLLRQTRYRYDESGRSLETASYGADGAMLRTQTASFDPDGNRIEFVDLGIPDVEEEGFAIYGVALPELVGSAYISLEGARSLRLVYDPEDRILEVTALGQNGAWTSRSAYEYDGGRLVRQYCYVRPQRAEHSVRRGTRRPLATDGSVLRTAIEYRYDSLGRAVEEVATAYLDEVEEPLTGRVVSSYDAEGTRTTRRLLPGDQPLEEAVHDAHGRLLRRAHYDHQGTLRSEEVHVYELDEYGNWVKQILTLSNGDPPTAVASRIEAIRQITYLDTPE